MNGKSTFHCIDSDRPSISIFLHRLLWMGFNLQMQDLSMSVEPSIIMAWAGKSGEKIVSDLPP